MHHETEISKKVQTAPLAFERAWMRLQWRTAAGISRDTPVAAAAVVITPESNEQDPIAWWRPEQRRQWQSLVRELRWIVPGIRFGLCVISPPSDSDASRLGIDPLDEIQFTHQAQPLMDWMCGSDVWLLPDESPLSESLRNVAQAIRLPCVSAETVRHSGPSDVCSASPLEILNPIAVAHDIAAALQDGNASYSASASGTPSVDVVRGIDLSLEKAINSLQNVIQTALGRGKPDFGMGPSRRAA